MVLYMIVFLNKIRTPVHITKFQKITCSFLIFIVGAILGLISKMLDETPSNVLPVYLEVLDLENFFSRMGGWIFIAVIISLYSKSPIRSATYVFLFFLGMVSSYYCYTIMVAGFFPKSYMIIWIAMTITSPALAVICWYARGKGFISLLIASTIFLFMLRQAFTFGFWYFDIRYVLESILFIMTIFMLYQSPKQMIQVTTMGLLLFLLTAQISLFGGML